VNQREADIVLKLCDGEVDLQFVLQVGVLADSFEQRLREGSNHRLLIVIDDILEELVDKFYFEICQIKPCIVVAIVLICEVQDDFVPLAFLSWEDKLVD
jgi:hypothetical protein